jgi:hypothetical protein
VLGDGWGEDLDRAIPLYEQTLTVCVRVLGEDHPISALVRDNLAAALGDAGRRE